MTLGSWQGASPHSRFWRWAPASSSTSTSAPTTTVSGYWVLADSGQVFPHGNAPALGDLTGALRPGEAAAALSATPSGRGSFAGSLGSAPPGRPVVAVAALEQ